MDNENETRNETRNVVEEIVALIRSEKSDGEIRAKLEDYHESDLADALEQITKEERKNARSCLRCIPIFPLKCIT